MEIKEVKNNIVLRTEISEKNWEIIFNKYNLEGYAVCECSGVMRLYSIGDAKFGMHINKTFIPQLLERCNIEFRDFCVVFGEDNVFIVKGGERIGKGSFVREVDIMKFWRIVVDAFKDNSI